MALSETGKTWNHRVETGGFFAKSCTLFSRLVYTGDALTSLLSNPSDLRVWEALCSCKLCSILHPSKLRSIQVLKHVKTKSTINLGFWSSLPLTYLEPFLHVDDSQPWQPAVYLLREVHPNQSLCLYQCSSCLSQVFQVDVGYYIYNIICIHNIYIYIYI